MKNRTDLAGLNLSNPLHFLAVGLGSGLAPKAPGTFGTLAAIPLYLLLLPLSSAGYLGVLLVATLFGFWCCHQTSKDMGVHDHKAIVWDEFVGFWITMFAAPAGWVWIIAGFVLFRLFDVLKPWPISWLDKHLHGGIGIMMDDVLAGLAAFACLQLLAGFWG
ncbi:phosphatidylglycerophosphatase A family protein [Motilimonas eburnea]|uniref:phosphatidylglycerophosphatase A family protein n=1 Tax=Motilimonas eburnea TaxID=1737488 RepID=UPI001E3D6525|nr:phosphatidylglycerophosphatase A [Motilimonas eburnea]MCE2573687.1 phosphatidylglycerophosphatase A [Motilimonas eburnea]